jgi:GT2 family glycosyltransferase
MNSLDRDRIVQMSTKDWDCGRARVSILIVIYNNWDQTGQCLKSLSRIDFPSRRVILVDNGSRIPCPDWIRSNFPDAELLINTQNLGYAHGCNYGIPHARKQNPDYIWFLNDDTEVQPRSLRALVELCDSDQHIGAAGSLLLDPGPAQNVQAWGGGRINFFTGLSPALQKPDSRPDYVCGASMLVRCSALDEVGLLNPGFFLYWEDTDLCYRLRAAGWKLAVANQSVVIHKGSASSVFQSPFYDYHFTASSIRFFRMHYRCWPVPVLVSVAGRMTKRIVLCKFENATAVWRAFRNMCKRSTPAQVRS